MLIVKGEERNQPTSSRQTESGRFPALSSDTFDSPTD